MYTVGFSETADGSISANAYLGAEHWWPTSPPSFSFTCQGEKIEKTHYWACVGHKATSAGTHAQIGENVQFQYGTRKVVSSYVQTAAAVSLLLHTYTSFYRLLPMDGPSSATSELWMH